MECDLKLACSFLFGSFIIFNVTKYNFLLEKRISLLENNITHLKERTADLELFKLKCYSNEISIGKRPWDDNIEDEDYDYDDEI